MAAGAVGPQAAGGWCAAPAPGQRVRARPLPPRRPPLLPRGGGGSSPPPPALAPGDPAMPVRTECPPPAGASVASAASLIPPPPINTQQPGVATSLLYSGSKFRGHQKSKGNSYDVEVVLQVSAGRRAGPRASSRRSQAEPAGSSPRARSRDQALAAGPPAAALLPDFPAGAAHCPSPTGPQPEPARAAPGGPTSPARQPAPRAAGTRKPPRRAPPPPACPP